MEEVWVLHTFVGPIQPPVKLTTQYSGSVKLAESSKLGKSLEL
jgi:hypothetical protein